MSEVGTNLTEAQLCQQGSAGDILGEYSRYELGNSKLLGGCEQRLHHFGGQPLSSKSPAGVDRELGYSPVTIPRPVFRAPACRGHGAVSERNDGWVALATIAEGQLDILLGSRLYLEGGHPVFDALVIDLCNPGSIQRRGSTYQRRQV